MPIRPSRRRARTIFTYGDVNPDVVEALWTALLLDHLTQLSPPRGKRAVMLQTTASASADTTIETRHTVTGYHAALVRNAAGVPALLVMTLPRAENSAEWYAEHWRQRQASRRVWRATPIR